MKLQYSMKDLSTISWVHQKYYKVSLLKFKTQFNIVCYLILEFSTKRNDKLVYFFSKWQIKIYFLSSYPPSSMFSYLQCAKCNIHTFKQIFFATPACFKTSQYKQIHTITLQIVSSAFARSNILIQKYLICLTKCLKSVENQYNG